MIRCMIIEDEQHAVEALAKLVSGDPKLMLNGIYMDSMKAKKEKALILERADLVFLDIHMKGLSGLELAKDFLPSIQIVFTTAHRQYALEAFDLSAIDYLVKPIKLERFKSAIKKVQDKLSKSLLIQYEKKGKYIRLYCDDIAYIEADRNKSLIHFNDGSILTTTDAIHHLEEKLLDGQFQKIHRSYMVNMNYFKLYEKQHILLITGQHLPVSKSYYKSLEGYFRL